MQFQAELIDISAPAFTKTAKGGYNTIEVAFKRDGKVEGKKLLDFSAPVAFKAIQTYKRGDLILVTSEKDKNDYWQWTAISGDGAAGSMELSQTQQGGNSTAKATGGRVTGSNYETPEERKIKQRFIIRQSALTAALKSFELWGDKKFTQDQVKKVAEDYVSFVYQEPSAMEAIVDMEDDIPL